MNSSWSHSNGFYVKPKDASPFAILFDLVVGWAVPAIYLNEYFATLQIYERKLKTMANAWTILLFVLSFVFFYQL